MKRFIIIIAALLFLLAGCNNPADKPNGSVVILQKAARKSRAIPSLPIRDLYLRQTG